MSVTVNELTKRVKRGAHFLDVKKKDWPLEIDLTALKMNTNNACILGQVYGGYDDAGTDLGLRKWIEKEGDYDDRRAVYRGFMLDGGEMNPKNWSRLAELWAVEVALRQVRAAR